MKTENKREKEREEKENKEERGEQRGRRVRETKNQSFLDLEELALPYSVGYTLGNKPGLDCKDLHLAGAAGLRPSP
jgi:hypothetical protein